MIVLGEQTMNLRLAILMCLAVGQGAPAAGREVQLLDYSSGLPAPDIPSEAVGDGPRRRADAGGVAEGDLARAFAAVDANIKLEPWTAGSTVEVPLWMRAGVRPSRAGFHLLEVRSDPCSLSYRPRGDLHSLVEQRRSALFPLVVQIACESGLSPRLLDALIIQESRYDPQARSPMGAIGLTQLMPATARQLGVGNVWSVEENIRGGARYLRQQLDEFNRIDLALAAYNAGPGRVRRTRRVPAIQETQLYVAAILRAIGL